MKQLSLAETGFYRKPISKPVWQWSWLNWPSLRLFPEEREWSFDKALGHAVADSLCAARVLLL